MENNISIIRVKRSFFYNQFDNNVPIETIIKATTQLSKYLDTVTTGLLKLSPDQIMSSLNLVK